MYKYSLFLILLVLLIPFSNLAYTAPGDIDDTIIDTLEFDTSVNEKVDSVIPSWFKSNAKWWAEGILSEEEFLNALEYIIKEKIVEIPNLPEQGSDRGRAVPNWIKDSADGGLKVQPPKDNSS